MFHRKEEQKKTLQPFPNFEAAKLQKTRTLSLIQILLMIRKKGSVLLLTWAFFNSFMTEVVIGGRALQINGLISIW